LQQEVSNNLTFLTDSAPNVALRWKANLQKSEALSKIAAIVSDQFRHGSRKTSL
jgi:hypothetical protein